MPATPQHQTADQLPPALRMVPEATPPELTTSCTAGGDQRAYGDATGAHAFGSAGGQGRGDVGAAGLHEVGHTAVDGQAEVAPAEAIAVTPLDMLIGKPVR